MAPFPLAPVGLGGGRAEGLLPERSTHMASMGTGCWLGAQLELGARDRDSSPHWLPNGVAWASLQHGGWILRLGVPGDKR